MLQPNTRSTRPSVSTALKAQLLSAQSKKSLDASGGSVFRNLIRPAMLA